MLTYRPVQSTCHASQKLGSFESGKLKARLPALDKPAPSEDGPYPALGLTSPKATTATILEWRKNTKTFILGFNRTQS